MDTAIGRDAMGEKGGFCRHEASGCHKAAVEAMETFPETTGDIGELLSSAHSNEKACNRKNLMTVARCLRFMARQGMAIRGDGDEMDSNFHQLLLLKAIDDVTIYDLLAKKQDRYTSPKMQNELLQTMALSIIRLLETAPDLDSRGPWAIILGGPPPPPASFVSMLHFAHFYSRSLAPAPYAC